jgi:hypothetical protein
MRAPVTIAAIAGWLIAAAAPLLAQPAAPDGWVVLPVDEYRALRDRALGVTPPPPAPPVEATLTRVEYELQLNGDSITGRAVLTADVLAEGWARVPIPAGLMVRAARIDGRPVPLVEEGAPHLLLSRAGRSLVTLDLVVPLASAAGTDSIALPASAAPTTRIALVLPRSGVDLSVAGGFVAEQAEQPAETRNTTASSIARARPFPRRRRRWRPCSRTPSLLSVSTAQLRAAHSRWPAMSCVQA